MFGADCTNTVIGDARVASKVDWPVRCAARDVLGGTYDPSSYAQSSGARLAPRRNTLLNWSHGCVCCSDLAHAVRAVTQLGKQDVPVNGRSRAWLPRSGAGVAIVHGLGSRAQVPTVTFTTRWHVLRGLFSSFKKSSSGRERVVCDWVDQIGASSAVIGFGRNRPTISQYGGWCVLAVTWVGLSSWAFVSMFFVNIENTWINWIVTNNDTCCDDWGRQDQRQNWRAWAKYA